MNFIVEKDVPLVSSPRGRKPTEFPFQEMDTGDSFLIPIEGEDAKAVAKSLDSWRRKIRVSVKALQETHECKFSTAVVEGGLRVYRTA